jgi:hypothetical protein
MRVLLPCMSPLQQETLTCEYILAVWWLLIDCEKLREVTLMLNFDELSTQLNYSFVNYVIQVRGTARQPTRLIYCGINTVALCSEGISFESGAKPTGSYAFRISRYCSWRKYDTVMYATTAGSHLSPVTCTINLYMFRLLILAIFREYNYATPLQSFFWCGQLWQNLVCIREREIQYAERRINKCTYNYM